MRPSLARWTLLASGVAFLALAAASSQAATYFSYDCRADRAASGPLGEAHEFRAPISASPPTNDSIDVSMVLHMPDGWFGQYCQTSTGLCYFNDQRIRLVSGVSDTLRVDIFPDFQTAGMGYINITIKAAVDPLDIERCTYTLFSGKPLPSNPHYNLDCRESTRWVPSGDLVEFFSPMRNLITHPDTLLISMTQNMPAGWFAQFCQTSTGLCYFEDAQVPITPFLFDTLRVDFFTNNTHGAGTADLEIHSKRNPSFTTYCHYQVFHGNFPGDAPDPATGASRLWVVAQPNPFASSTTFRFGNASGGPGDLRIFAADGRLVRSFPPQELSAGTAPVRWDGRGADGESVPSGVYFYRLQAGRESTKGLLIRTR